MYQVLVRHFELFNDLPQPECYYCRKNVWSYDIKINSLWQLGGGKGETLKESLGRGVLPSYLNKKTLLFATLLK